MYKHQLQTERKTREGRVILLLCWYGSFGGIRRESMTEMYNFVFANVEAQSATREEMTKIMQALQISDEQRLFAPSKYLQIDFDQRSGLFSTWIPSLACGYVVGPKGEGTKDIYAKTGASIFIEPPEKAGCNWQRVFFVSKPTKVFCTERIIPLIHSRVMGLYYKYMLHEERTFDVPLKEYVPEEIQF